MALTPSLPTSTPALSPRQPRTNQLLPRSRHLPSDWPFLVAGRDSGPSRPRSSVPAAPPCLRLPLWGGGGLSAWRPRGLPALLSAGCSLWGRFACRSCLSLVASLWSLTLASVLNLLQMQQRHRSVRPGDVCGDVCQGCRCLAGLENGYKNKNV